MATYAAPSMAGVVATNYHPIMMTQGTRFSSATQVAPVTQVVYVETEASPLPANSPAAEVVYQAPDVPSQDGPVVSPPALQTTGEPTSYPYASKPSFPRGEGLLSRKSYVDITALPSFSHAEDYSWLHGQVEYSRLCHGWRLRYASVDDDDVHGGSVTLASDNTLYLKDGDEVLVHGRMSEPDANHPTLTYQLDSLEVCRKNK
jgi:hypothetical protein